MVRPSVPPAEASILDETVNQICGPGALFAGSRRQAVATGTRQVAMGATVSTDGVTSHIIAQLALNAQGVRPEWIASLSERGVGPLDLVELLGVVARTMAIDTFCFALGVDARPLPDPPSGAHVEAGPHGEVDASAACNGGWLPTVGPAWPTNALSAVPSENRAMHQLQAAFYLATGEMGELDVQRGLHRTQMELVAARTSLLNECFF